MNNKKEGSVLDFVLELLMVVAFGGVLIMFAYMIVDNFSDVAFIEALPSFVISVVIFGIGSRIYNYIKIKKDLKKLEMK